MKGISKNRGNDGARGPYSGYNIKKNLVVIVALNGTIAKLKE